MPERDTVATRRAGRPGPQVPLVHLEDPAYEQHDHLVLTDDSERRALAQVLRREGAEEWRKGLLTAQDRRRATLWASVVALASLGGLALSTVDLLLHLLK